MRMWFRSWEREWTQRSICCRWICSCQASASMPYVWSIIFIVLMLTIDSGNDAWCWWDIWSPIAPRDRLIRHLGELSALNGIAAAASEHVPLIHVVGQTQKMMWVPCRLLSALNFPVTGYRQDNHLMIHHSIGTKPDHQVSVLNI